MQVVPPGVPCDDTGAGCHTLTEALSEAALRASGLPCDLQLLNGVYSLDDGTGTAGMVFDASSAASEVRLLGEAGATIQLSAGSVTTRRRRTSTHVNGAGSAPSFLEIWPYAPPLTLRGLTFEGSWVWRAGVERMRLGNSSEPRWITYSRLRRARAC